MGKLVYKCPLCLSSDVEIKAWVKPNDNNEYSGGTSEKIEEEDCWCNRCEIHIALVQKEEE